jgi:polyisoprenoid-binding protein YceI
MRFIIASLTAFALLFSFPALADRYELDKEHTTILFFVNHLGFSDMIGKFTDYDGSFTFDPAAPEKSTLQAVIRPKGVQTSSAKLDEHLQNKDFFNSAQFPEIRFVSTGIKVTGENTGDVSGNLTMLGVTKPAVLRVRFNKADFYPMNGAFAAGFSADLNIKRSDFGMSYGVPMVSDEVRLHIETEGHNLDRKPPAAPEKR